MKQRFDSSLALRLVLLAILVGLMGLSPRAHALTRALREARMAQADGALLRASQLLAEAARRAPWQPNLWEQAGRCAFQAGDAETTIVYLEQARRASMSPWGLSGKGLSPEALTLLGDAYLQAGDPNAAIQTWQAAVDQAGPSWELAQRLVDAQLSLRDVPAAIASLQALLERTSEDALAHYDLGLLLATQAPEQSLAHLGLAAELDPDLRSNAEAVRHAILSGQAASVTGVTDPAYSDTADPSYSLLAAGRALAALDEWGLATEAFRQATLARPDYAEAWAYLGEALQHAETGTFSLTPPVIGPGAGLQEIHTALELDPRSLSAHTFLALFWARQGRYDLALQAIQSAVALDPKNPALQVQLASIQASSGRLEQAYETYLQAIELSPRDPAYWRYLIQFSLQYDYQVEQVALPTARRLVGEYPQQAANLDLMAQVLVRLGDLDNGGRFLERALQADSSYAPAHLHLGLVYALQEDLASAYREWQAAIALAPTGSIADQARRYVETFIP